MSRFDGFPKSTMTFLKQLAKNNNRDWFQENKDRYERDWLAPSLAFIEAMEKPLGGISPFLSAIAKRSGGSIMRIYRDTRFSKEKIPYKTNIGIHFRHQMAKDVHAPGIYVHIEPGSVFLGVGIWRPDSSTVKQIRNHIDHESDQWRRATQGKAFLKELALSGDSLKRPPAGFDAEHPWIDDLKRKDFIAVKDLAVADIHQADFVKTTIATMKKAKPLMQFLCEAISVPF